VSSLARCSPGLLTGLDLAYKLTPGAEQLRGANVAGRLLVPTSARRGFASACPRHGTRSRTEHQYDAYWRPFRRIKRHPAAVRTELPANIQASSRKPKQASRPFADSLKVIYRKGSGFCTDNSKGSIVTMVAQSTLLYYAARVP